MNFAYVSAQPCNVVALRARECISGRDFRDVSAKASSSARTQGPKVSCHKWRVHAVSEAEKQFTQQAVKQTVGGGGYAGFCDIAQVKEALETCKGLEGAALEACWADCGCSIDEVTDHYSKVAGISKEEKQTEFKCFLTHEGALVADGLPSGLYNVSAWWAGADNNVDESEGMDGIPACNSLRQEDCMLIATLVSENDLVRDAVTWAPRVRHVYATEAPRQDVLVDRD